METIRTFFRDYVAWLSMPSINVIDIIEIIIIAFAVYHIVMDQRYPCLGVDEGNHCAFSGVDYCDDSRDECTSMDFPECDGDRNYGYCNHISTRISECSGTDRKSVV